MARFSYGASFCLLLFGGKVVIGLIQMLCRNCPQVVVARRVQSGLLMLSNSERRYSYMRMRKLIALTAAALICCSVSLTGCNKDGSSSKSSSSASSSKSSSESASSDAASKASGASSKASS